MRSRYSIFSASLVFLMIFGAVLIPARAADVAEAAPPENMCNLRHPSACETTNDLMRASGTLQAIREFLANEQGNFFYSRPVSSAVDDAITVLHGPPDFPVRRPDGLTVFEACRAHSCSEKGALLLAPRSRIVAIAIAHFRCGKGTCDRHYTVTIFVGDPQLRRQAVSILANWFPIGRQARIEIRAVYRHKTN